MYNIKFSKQTINGFSLEAKMFSYHGTSRLQITTITISIIITEDQSIPGKVTALADPPEI
jgi:hypothetical protein